MRVRWIKRKHKNKTYSYPFVVESYRNENGKPRNRTVANLTGLPEQVIQEIEYSLQTEKNISEAKINISSVKFEKSVSIGPSWAAIKLMEQLGISEQLKQFEPKGRAALTASIIDRVMSEKPYSTKALHQLFKGSTTERVLNHPKQGSLDLWYKSFEKIADKQMEIQKALFKRNHKKNSRIILYDITSSYFEGECCPLAAYGYNRDQKKGKQQMVIGATTDEEGQPIAVKVFKGNTKDETTVLDQIKELKDTFNIEEVVFVGDRGMITSGKIKELEQGGYKKWLRYITAIKRTELMAMVEDQTHSIQLGLFDEHNLVEVSEGNKRYILCHNPLKKEEDAFTRERLIELTEAKLQAIQIQVGKGRLKQRDKIAKRVYRWVNKWNMERFFTYSFDEATFKYEKNEAKIEDYSRLDGCYVITTNLEIEKADKHEVVSRYKSLSQVEQLFRTMKTTDIEVRPIRKWNEKRVRGHVFVCLLAYLMIWKARKLLSHFLVRDPITKECIGGSLKEIWVALENVQIGSIKFGSVLKEQINQFGSYQKQLLKALHAPLTKNTSKVLSLRI